MKIELLVVGKTDLGYWKEALEAYQSRLVHYIPFEITVIPDIRNVKNMTTMQQKEREGEAILKCLQPGDHVVLLDEKGKEYTSVQFAGYLEKQMQVVPKRLVFVIGGPYGYSDVVYQKVRDRLSLSKMTFSHQMIRPVFVEQLYRAMTIVRNEPYHHE